MKPCPHCKQSDQGFIVCGQMAGPAYQYYDKDGNYEELNIDKSYFKNLSHIVHCANCGKIRRDVVLNVNETVLELSALEVG